MSRWKEPIVDLSTCGLPPVGSAPFYRESDPGHILERERYCAAVTDDGTIVAVKNPCVWESREHKGKVYRTRPRPIPLADALRIAPNAKRARQDAGDRILSQAEGATF